MAEAVKDVVKDKVLDAKYYYENLTKVPFYLHCRCEECTYPTSHMTIAHKCGICGGFGHGLLECGDKERLKRLRRNVRKQARIETTEPRLESFPKKLQCTNAKCKYKQTHSIGSHEAAFE
jgi:hypothetical protein